MRLSYLLLVLASAVPYVLASDDGVTPDEVSERESAKYVAKEKAKSSGTYLVGHNPFVCNKTIGVVWVSLDDFKARYQFDSTLPAHYGSR